MSRAPAPVVGFPTPSARGGRGSAGFTLVELLIALSLIALITLLLFSGLNLASRAWEGVERVAERNAEQRVARSLLERILPQARAASVRLADGERLAFSGQPDALELVAPLTHWVGAPGLYVVRLSLQPYGERPGLVLTRWLLHPEVLAGTAEFPAWEPLTEQGVGDFAEAELDRDWAAGAYGRSLLLEQVEEFEIAYFGLLAGEEQPEWLDEWIDQPVLPQRIRIRVTTATGSWPELLVGLPEGGQ